MKYLSSLLVLLMFLVVACQQNSPALTDAEKNDIAGTVRTVFDRMVAGMNEHDAEKIARSYLRSDRFHLSGEGNLRSDWENWLKNLTEWHSANQGWSVALDEVIIDVLSRDMAIVTATGMTTQPDKTGKVIRRGYTVTDLFQRQNDGWLIINEHESVSDPRADGV